MFLQELSLTNMITDLHLLVIHFPIALLSIAVLFDFLFYFTRRDDLISASWWTMLFGVISCFAAVITGFVSDTLYEHLFSTWPIWENHGAVQIFSFVLFKAGLFGQDVSVSLGSVEVDGYTSDIIVPINITLLLPISELK